MAELDKLTCVHHGGNKIHIRNFYIASSVSIFKGIGYIPICKRCLFEIADEYYKKYKSIEIAIYYMCRRVDVAFDRGIYEGALKKDEDSARKVFQSYMVQYNSLGQTNNTQLSFDEGEHITVGYDAEKYKNNTEIPRDESNDETDVKIFWGHGFDEPYDYDFLEIELANWKKTHKCDNQAEITLLREICIKILEIRKLRELKQSVSKEQKELQELMKTASVDPAKANVADSGKSLDAYGLWVKDTEQFEPAEYFEDKMLFNDFDGIKKYTDRYILRPLKNLLTGSRDFNISDNINDVHDSNNEDGDS